MKRLILALPILLMACEKQIEYVTVKPDIPTETLTPCAISDRKVSTVKELAALTTEHLRSAECANGKIEAIADIVSAVSFAASASGPKCGPSLFILQQLSRYGEVVHEQITRDGVDWIMWVNEETGTWTLTGTHDVVTCAFAWGKDYDGRAIKDLLLGAAL